MSISLTKNVINVDETTTAKTTVLPDNAEDKTLTYSSGDSAIATVTQGGVVAGISAGATDIEIKSKNNKTAKAKITVEEPEPGPETAKAKAKAK